MVSTIFARLKNATVRFFKDEEGLGTLEIVIILAIAAIVALAIFFFGEKIIEWVKGLLKTLTGKSEGDLGEQDGW